MDEIRCQTEINSFFRVHASFGRVSQVTVKHPQPFHTGDVEGKNNESQFLGEFSDTLFDRWNCIHRGGNA